MQLIDASQWFKPLRKNLGKKNCELSPEDIERIRRTFLDFKETPESKIFPNAAFGYWKVTVERPLRLHSQLTLKAIETLRFASGDEDIAIALYEEFGDDPLHSFARVASGAARSASPTGVATRRRRATTRTAVPARRGCPRRRKKLLDPKTWERDGRLVETAHALCEQRWATSSSRITTSFATRGCRAQEAPGSSSDGRRPKQILKAVSWRVESAPPVIAKVHKPGKAKADPLRGLFEATGSDGKPTRDRRIRARLRPARHRAGAAAGRRRHRGLHPPRGAALHARRLDQGGRHQDRLRGELHPPLLQAAAAAHARGDQRRHPRYEQEPRGCWEIFSAAVRSDDRAETLLRILTPAAGWLTSLPSHWKESRGKNLFTLMSRPVRPGDDVVTCFRDGVVTLRKNRRTSGFTESLKEIGYQGVRRGDLVIHAMDAFAGAVGVSDSDGKATPVYAACQPHVGVDPYFYAHLVRQMALSRWITALATGIRERSTDFRFAQFAVQVFPLPPLVEQQAIVKYIRHVEGEVGSAVQAKQRLIGLLAEQKRVILHQASLGGSISTRL